DHACSVELMHEQDLQERPEWTQKVVNALVQALAWIQDNREQTARIVSKDNAQRYTPHSYEALAHVLQPELLNTQLYESNGAIVNTDLKEMRIDFLPYPFPSYTEQLIVKLTETLVLRRNELLCELEL